MQANKHLLAASFTLTSNLLWIPVLPRYFQNGPPHSVDVCTWLSLSSFAPGQRPGVSNWSTAGEDLRKAIYHYSRYSPGHSEGGGTCCAILSDRRKSDIEERNPWTLKKGPPSATCASRGVCLYAPPFARPCPAPSSEPPRLWRLFACSGRVPPVTLPSLRGVALRPGQIVRFSQACFQGSIPTVPIAARRTHKRRRYAEAEEEKTGKGVEDDFRQVTAAKG